ncbi:MAG: hypothetical protein ACK53K_09840 [Burkholderiales bacterium]
MTHRTKYKKFLASLWGYKFRVQHLLDLLQYTVDEQVRLIDLAAVGNRADAQ